MKKAPVKRGGKKKLNKNNIEKIVVDKKTKKSKNQKDKICNKKKSPKNTKSDKQGVKEKINSKKIIKNKKSENEKNEENDNTNSQDEMIVENENKTDLIKPSIKSTHKNNLNKISSNNVSTYSTSNSSKSKEKINTQTYLTNFFTPNSKNKQENNLNTSSINILNLSQKNNINTSHTSNSNLYSSSKVERPNLSENKQITIYSWNVNGFRALMSKGDIESFINKENPDILCFNETKIDDKALVKENYSEKFSKNYSLYWNCCKSKAGYSGVAIFSKIKPINIIYGINSKEHDQEGRALTLEFENYFLISSYVPNSGEGLKRLDYRTKEWDIEFTKFLNNLKLTKDVILCGDLNVAHHDVDIFQPKGHLKYAGFTLDERNNFTKLLKTGFVDSFRHLNPNVIKFSYFSARFGKKNLQENKGWRLDYFVVSEDAMDRVVNSEILNHYDASDHSPIKLTWKI